MSDKKIIREINADEQALNDLFKEMLDGLRDDMIEATNNAEEYFDIINGNADQRALFGTLYHEALKVKGSARDRQLKFLNSFKERVSKKESDLLAKEIKGLGKNTSASFNHNDMNKTLEDLLKAGELTRLLEEAEDNKDSDE